MATPIVRTTYALDAQTVAHLDRLARAWKLSRSAALRKLIGERPIPAGTAPDPRLQALEQYQAAAQRLTPGQEEAWIRRIRRQRRADTQRMLRRTKAAGD